MSKMKLPSIVLVLMFSFALFGCPTRPGPGGDSDARAGNGGANAGGAGVAGPDGMAGAVGTTDGGAGAGAVGAGGAGVGGAAGGGGHASVDDCNPACSSTQICVGSKCLLEDGQPCSLSSQCATSTCTPFYLDADGDGYGAGPAAGFCGTATPVGYASQNGDCCDDSSHVIAKLIHPGAGFQTTSAGGVCNVTWDYDCDGMVETSQQQGMCSPASVYPDNCINVAQPYPENDCGTNVSPDACTAYPIPGGSCTAYPDPEEKGTLGCR